MDDGAKSAAGGTSSCGAGAGSSHHLIGSRIEQHRKYMSESSCCPRCGHKIDRKLDWVGLPAGVKFDPTDQELIEHLEAKVRSSGTAAAAASPSHPLIDEFIPTIEGEDGICYTHPEKLPGVSKDGLSRHFFHRPSKAYTTGTRKRRKIQPTATADAPSVSSGGAGGSMQQQQQRSETRWHKTGKTRPVAVGGQQRGCKKILVLYTNFGKHRKPEKTNWVMHQYHLGESEEEREGELVVSKIFYQTQPRQCGIADGASARSAVEKRRVNRAVVAEPAPRMTSSDVIRAAFHGGAPAGIEDFSFTQFRNSFGEVGVGRSDHQVVQARADEGVLQRSAALHHHHHHQHHLVDEHDHRRRHHHYTALQQEQQRAAAVAAVFHVSMPTDPIATLIAAPRAHHGSVLLTAPAAEPYDPGAASYHHQQEDERPHQTRKFDGRSTSGLEEVIMGCTSMRSKGGEISGNKEGTEWQYPSFWPSDNQDHHG